MIQKTMDLDDEIDLTLLEKGYIPISYCASNALLMVGNSDEVFLFSRWKNPNLEYVSANIFDFFKTYIIQPELIDTSKLHNLYKNWGEDFWRTK